MLTKKESIPFEMIISQLPENIKSEAMTTYDDIIEKEVKKGIKKNLTDIVLRSYDNNYSIKDIVIITGLSDKEVKEILKSAGRKVD